MFRFFIVILIFCFHFSAFANPGNDYLDKFIKYRTWSQHLPTTPDPVFINFINANSPLSNKLREKWLYQLAWNKDWKNYLQYYQYATDINLQCYQQIARYQLDLHYDAVESAKLIWLTGNSLPKPCDDLFALLLKNKEISESLISQRLILALDQMNVNLAIFLLKQYSPPKINEVKLLKSISQNPKMITHLSQDNLHKEFYLYALKRIVYLDPDSAIFFWKVAIHKELLNIRQQQSFLSHLALFKAIRNHDDAEAWFAKIHPNYYNEILIGWQIRYALKNNRWRKVVQLINRSQEKYSACWQYWLARALGQTGEQERSFEIFKKLAQERNYYAFLASLRLQKKLSFKNERPVSNSRVLQTYYTITKQIKELYLSKQSTEASRLLNDFMSELPKQDKSALTYWVAHDLKWPSKAVYLSSNDELNNQLDLRFPLAYKQTIYSYGKNYHISPEFIYAIIRQESAFRDDVVSSAGAHGLMQLMPATAKVISKQEHIPYSNKNQLFSSQKNINIGVAYLKQLAKRFNQHPILMAAAYNAGPRQVSYWLKNHPPKDIDIWIETLPWAETRNYLKNVIAFYAVYQYLLQEKPDLKPFMQSFS